MRIAAREAVMRSAFFLPATRRVAFERWWRGRDEYRTLQRADAVVVSFGKSGRTWLRVMLSRFYQVKHHLGQHQLLGFDNLHRQHSAIPKIFFTHDNYLSDYTGHGDSKADFAHTKVVLLVRDPRDIAVSQYFQWKYRMRPVKKQLNGYPPHGAEVAIDDFVMDPQVGLPKIIAYLNAWAKASATLPHLLTVRYEDMRVDPKRELKAITEFLNTPGSDANLDEAVRFAAYENMKNLEQKRTFWLSGRRLTPGDRSNPDAYKVRRAKVGGYRDYFDEEQIGAIDRLIESQLDPALGYGQPLEKGAS